VSQDPNLQIPTAAVPPGAVIVTPKPWYQSATIQVNAVLLFLSFALALPEVAAIIPPDWSKYMAAVTALVNLALRFKTMQPVGK
jgi:hypothetical protein